MKNLHNSNKPSTFAPVLETRRDGREQPASIKRKKQLLLLSAEKEGFEPPEPLSSTVFKTAAIDHSAISPCL